MARNPHAFDAPTAVDGVDEDTQPSAAEAPPEVEGPRPRRIGRYMIVEELGAGGMGRVELAYDTKLHREVALKILHPRVNSSVAARGRMLREAQAMAQLSHPNVVPIFDVELDDDDRHITMEYVRGQTLDRWLESKPGVDAIIQAFREAGLGLLAAHQAGLVHRDFKLNNVMIGDDGRARVMDFGLARGDLEVEPARTDDDASARSHTSLSASYTIDGTIAGTPLYMAPEQYTEQPVDARADQFAYCVALIVALTNEAPYEAGDFTAVAKAKRAGRVRLPASLPSWIAPIVRRGLAPKPEERWPSMAELLAALERDPSAKRQRRLALAALASSVLVAAAAIVFGPTNAVAVPVCVGAATHVEPIWNAARRAEIEQAVLATERSYAAAVSTKVTTGLDAYTRAWIDARTEACEATRIRGEQSEAMLDQRMHCLDRRLDEVDALVALLAEADAALVDNAANLIDGLAPLTSCDAAALLDRRALPTDPEARAELAAASKATAQAKALFTAGKVAESITAAGAARAHAAEHAFPWLEAEAALISAQARIAVGEFDQARADLTHGVLVSDAAAEDRLRADLLAALMRNAMHKEGDLEAAERFSKAAAAVVERLGSPPDAELDMINARAIVLAEQGRHDEAIAALERGIGLGERHGLRLAEIKGTYGAVLIASGRHREALEINQAMLAEAERQLGPNHPHLLDWLQNVSISLQALGEHAQALAASDRLVALQKSINGEHSPDLADTYNNRAVVYSLLGRYDDAAADYQLGLDIWTEIAPRHPRRGVALFNLAEAHLHRERPEDAMALLDEASQLFAESLPPGHPYNAFADGNRGWALIQLGRHAEAVAMLEPALELIHASHIDALGEAQIRILLGEALEHTGEHARARALITEAKASVDEIGATYWSERAQAWLSRNRN